MRDEKNSKVTLKQGLLNTWRGLKIIRELFPWYLTIAICSSVVQSAQPLVALFFSARVLDELAGARDIMRIALYVCLTVGLTFALAALNAAIARKIAIIDAEAREKTYLHRSEKFAAMDFEYVEQSRVKDMLSDMDAKQNAHGLGLMRLYDLFHRLIRKVSGLILSVLLLAGMFNVSVNVAGSFITSPWAAALLAAAMLVPIVLRILLMRRASRIMLKVFEILPKMNTLYGYYLGYVRPGGAAKDIRIYRQQGAILDIFRRYGDDSWVRGITSVNRVTASVTAAANAIVSGLTYLLIGLRALMGMYGIGQVVQYVGAVTAFSDNLSGLISTWAMIWENNLYLPVLYEYLDLPDIKYKGSLTTEKRADNEYEIEFHNVSFKYPGSDAYALRELNLKLNIGERLAVVGMNGSGKTTMIKLLCRLYDPTEGYITLNGIDIRKYDYDEYMGIFSVVFQDFRLLAFPLGQNVAASVGYDAARIVECLEKVGFAERFAALPGGLDTALYKDYDENGVIISGGEAQKLALARAIYKDAPFIVLDEPTAALDPIAEYEIYSKFDALIGGKTAIYISHRLSSCRFCDDIAVFHEGRLVQRGSHESLVADEEGKYYELWHAQAQYYA